MAPSPSTKGSRQSGTLSVLAAAVPAMIGVLAIVTGAFLAVRDSGLLVDGVADDRGVAANASPADVGGGDGRAGDSPRTQEVTNQELLERYEATVEADPTDHGALYRLADIEQLVGRPVDSIAHLERAIELAEEPSYYRSLAPIYASVGKWAESVEAWQNYMALAELDEAGRAQVHASIASAQEGAREYDKARASLEQALALDPGSENYKVRLEAYGD